LEQTFQERTAALEADYKSKVDALAQRESELDKRQKDLDDRDNTHARWQIQQGLKEVLKQRNTDFSLTEKTGR
jgi:hypothetical protein